MDKYQPLLAEDQDQEIQPRFLTKPRSFWAKRPSFTVFSLLFNFVAVSTIAIFWWTNKLGTYEVKCYLPTDVLWGREIPWQYRVLEPDDLFKNSDPFDGRWNEDPDYQPERKDGEEVWGPWDDIYSGSWVTIQDAKKIGYDGGTSMMEYGSKLDPMGWTPADEVFGIGFMHQIHCVGSLKHLINNYRRNPNSTENHHHTDHCLEILRQAIMCHGDMTLQLPNQPLKPGEDIIGTTGFGSTYLCRDWDTIRELAFDHSVYYSHEGQGWVHGKSRIPKNHD